MSETNSTSTAARLELEAVSTLHVGPISLRINAGECVGVQGASGSGKTLLLRAIADLDPHQGVLRLDGVGCENFRGHEWRRRVGLLPAEAQWWRDRIGAHFPEESRAALEPLLTQLGFGPQVLGWEVARCSTGERQRLALARLLLRQPEVLLLDEPTASLDAENIGRVESLLSDYRQRNGTALLWVSHDPAQLQRVADRRLILVNGQLQEG